MSKDGDFAKKIVPLHVKTNDTHRLNLKFYGL